MRWYPWLFSHFKQLITGYQTGQEHYALLVQALPGMGDDVLIYAIARFLLCKHHKKYRSCGGNCRDCQLMHAGTHPDYHILKPEKGKSVISINVVHYVSEKLYEHACFGGAKVLWLNDTTLLTETAANALLKIIEEPPEKTWFFLSWRETGSLLATLRSRCRLYHLPTPKEEWAVSWLRQEITVSQDVALAALRSCSNAPAAALELLQENYWKQRVQLCSVLGNVLKENDWLSLLTVLNHEQAPIYLRWLITLLLDALKLQHGAITITNIDVWPLVSSLAKVLTNSTLHAIIDTLCQCRKQLLTITGLNRELLLTDQLMIIEHYLESDAVLPVFHI